MKVVYDLEIKKILDSFLFEMGNVVAGHMFGYPAYYVNKRLFACIYNKGVGLKLPVHAAKILSEKAEIQPFIPMGGRQMKEWIHIVHDQAEDYLEDQEIFKQSILFVASLKK